MKRRTIAILALVLFAVLTTQVLAAQPIKLLVNGTAVDTDVSPQVNNGRVLVPIRWVAQALGAHVDWDDQTKSVKIDAPENVSSDTSLERRIELLQQALAPKTPEEAAQKWAEGVKMRNGALQYAVLSLEFQEQRRADYEDLGWVTGTSSPWVDSYKIMEQTKKDDTTWEYKIQLALKTSTGDAGSTLATLLVKQYEDNWFIDQLSEEHLPPTDEQQDIPLAELTGTIKELETDEQVRFLLEGAPMTNGEPLLVWISIMDDTQIVLEQTGEDHVGKVSDLQVGQKVAVELAGPMLESYPAQAGAAFVRILK
ncbi:MAG: stalk domain-containing protein [bacterium]|jgi:hypothetical protein